jgi:HK97 family phage major capsid protein
MEAIERIEKSIGDAVTKIGADLAANKGSLDALSSRLDKLEARGNRLSGGGSGEAEPLVIKAITSAPGFQALKSGANTSGRIALPGTLGAIRKQLFSTLAGGSPNVGFTVLPQMYPGVGNDPRRKLRLLDALPHIQVTSNVFEWQQLNGYVDLAADQGAEGAVKTETTIPFALKTAKICTVAHFVKASRQVLDDVPMLSNYVQGLLEYGVSLKLEQLIVAGATVGSILGLLTEATPFAPTALKAADQISEAQATLAGEGWNVGLLILNPLDWHKIRSERSTTAYFSGGWTEPPDTNVWSLPLVWTPSCPAGTAIVAAPDACAILDRSQATVMLGFSNDDFTRNLVTVLAEVRAGFAVLSAGAIFSVPLTF